MAGKKRLPYLQLYTQDIRGEQTLLRCSFEARYVWREMLGFMHESPDRGFLLHANGDPMTEQDLANMIAPDPHFKGDSLERMRNCLYELEMNGVFSRDRRKIIYNRRMVRDEKKATTARTNGKGGGNPKLKSGDKSEINPRYIGDKSDLEHGVSPENIKGIQPSVNLTLGIPETRDQRPLNIVSNNKQQQQHTVARAAVEFGKQIGKLTGMDKDPRWFGDAPRIERWLSQGWDFDLDIIPAIQRVMARRTGPPNSLKFFEPAIADQHAERLTPLPKGTANARPTQPTRSERARESLEKALQDPGPLEEPALNPG